MKKKAPPKKISSAPKRAKLPSMLWFPAFIAGLSLGILIHFIPGMDKVLEQTRNKNAKVQQHKKEQPVMWRPTTRYSRS